MASAVLETLGLITSSGILSSGITFFATRKTQKVDLSQKTIDFWEGKADNYLKRLDSLEKKQELLESLKCENVNCENRL